ncbi:MAG: hypothetical protein JNN16_14170 [Nitrospira sp.]|nr:hypothetical protein [Nitrospira sp.]MBS0166531.1 hypothetical protein [Nitrospira sp.]
MQIYPCYWVFTIVSTLAFFPVSNSLAEEAIQQGQWRTTEEVLEMVNPLLAPEMIEKRKSTPMTVEFCVRSNSLETLLGVGKDKHGLCEGPINIGMGKISIQRTCTTGLGKSIQKIDGTYTPTRVERIREDTTDTPKGKIHMKTKAVIERIGGECKP